MTFHTTRTIYHCNAMPFVLQLFKKALILFGFPFVEITTTGNTTNSISGS